jgi:hypothetical protein
MKMINVMLRRQFIFRPYLLSSVSKPFDGIKHAYELYRLAGQYLPEEQEKLFGLSPTDAAKRFIKVFGERYFQLAISESDQFTYDHNAMRQVRHGLAERLPEKIAVKFLGMERYQYEPGFGRTFPMSQLLAETLCVCPFMREKKQPVQCSRAMYTDRNRADDRLAVVENFKTQLLESNAMPLLQLIPEQGFPLDEVVRALEGSEWPGLAIKAQWVFHKTGCKWLDTVDENQYGAIGNGYKWNKENVSRLAKDWQTYLVMKKQMDAFESWIGHTPAARCGEVIRYIAQKIQNKPGTLMEVFNGNKS